MENTLYNLALGLPGLILAICCHEASHAYAAAKFGDPTAKNAGRLTINPVPHIDLIGSLLIPLVSAILGGIMFGWAKPVPINERAFKNPRKAVFWVSFAGPLMNIFLCILCAFLMGISLRFISPEFYLFTPLVKILKEAVYINAILAAFNLIPLPPLDGSKMIMSQLNYNWAQKYQMIGNYSFLILLFLIITNLTRYIFYPALIFANWLISIFYHYFLSFPL